MVSASFDLDCLLRAPLLLLLPPPAWCRVHYLPSAGHLRQQQWQQRQQRQQQQQLVQLERRRELWRRLRMQASRACWRAQLGMPQLQIHRPTYGWAEPCCPQLARLNAWQPPSRLVYAAACGTPFTSRPGQRPSCVHRLGSAGRPPGSLRYTSG